jgi:hypothetical protein
MSRKKRQTKGAVDTQARYAESKGKEGGGGGVPKMPLISLVARHHVTTVFDCQNSVIFNVIVFGGVLSVVTWTLVLFRYPNKNVVCGIRNSKAFGNPPHAFEGRSFGVAKNPTSKYSLVAHPLVIKSFRHKSTFHHPCIIPLSRHKYIRHK